METKINNIIKISEILKIIINERNQCIKDEKHWFKKYYEPTTKETEIYERLYAEYTNKKDILNSILEKINDL